MEIIVKGLKGFKVFKETEDYILKKFSKFEKIVTEPTIMEFTLNHTHSSRQTLDKVVHLTATMPGLKSPEHLEEIGTKFEESIDLLSDRFDKFVIRWKEKTKIGTRHPRKRVA
jgi:ribosome-associated translation inhibitor RaiA